MSPKDYSTLFKMIALVLTCSTSNGYAGGKGRNKSFENDLSCKRYLDSKNRSIYDARRTSSDPKGRIVVLAAQPAFFEEYDSNLKKLEDVYLAEGYWTQRVVPPCDPSTRETTRSAKWFINVLKTLHAEAKKINSQGFYTLMAVGTRIPIPLSFTQVYGEIPIPMALGFLENDWGFIEGSETRFVYTPTNFRLTTPVSHLVFSYSGKERATLESFIQKRREKSILYSPSRDRLIGRTLMVSTASDALGSNWSNGSLSDSYDRVFPKILAYDTKRDQSSAKNLAKGLRMGTSAAFLWGHGKVNYIRTDNGRYFSDDADSIDPIQAPRWTFVNGCFSNRYDDPDSLGFRLAMKTVSAVVGTYLEGKYSPGVFVSDLYGQIQRGSKNVNKALDGVSAFKAFYNDLVATGKINTPEIFTTNILGDPTLGI